MNKLTKENPNDSTDFPSINLNDYPTLSEHLKTLVTFIAYIQINAPSKISEDKIVFNTQLINELGLKSIYFKPEIVSTVNSLLYLNENQKILKILVLIINSMLLLQLLFIDNSDKSDFLKLTFFNLFLISLMILIKYLKVKDLKTLFETSKIESLFKLYDSLYKAESELKNPKIEMEKIRLKVQGILTQANSLENDLKKS